MTTTLTTPATTAPTASRVTGGRVLRAEWAKLWSLRSTWITLAVSLVVMVSFGMIAAASWSPSSNAQDGPAAGAHDAVALALGGLDFAQMAVGVLGVLLIAGEYSTGLIRATMTAVPGRLPVLWSKAALAAGAGLLVGCLGATASFLCGSGFLRGTAVASSLSDSGVLGALMGVGLSLALAAVISVSLGTLLRSTAGGIASFIGLFTLLPVLTGLLPDSFDSINRYLPSNAAASIHTLTHASDTLSAGAGAAVLIAWTVAFLAAAAYRLKRSDV